MTPRIIKKNALEKTIQKWMKKFDVIAPIDSKEGIHFRRIEDTQDIAIDKSRKSIYPPKNLFLPQSEVLFEYKNGDFIAPQEPKKQRIIFGMRPCDARAVWLLDTVFKKRGDLDLYWGRKRENALIISLGCPSLCESGFCDTVGSGPFGREGSDILITELNDGYFLKPYSKRGDELISNLAPADEAHKKNARTVQRKSTMKDLEAPNLETIRDKLYKAFDTPIWSEVSESCIGCGVCTYLCPTCFCFDIVDEVDRNERVRNWDTCMFRIYSQEASGHNPRPGKAERTRQRIMHKFAYWVDNEAASGCTGCGRCVELCPVNLDIREMVKEITTIRVQ